MSRMLLFSTGSCAFGSMVALEWAQQPYRLCRVAVEDHHAPVHLAINPTGEVPSLILDSGVLTESFAILHHIGANSKNPRITPRQGTAEFDRFNMILSYLTSTFHPAFRPIIHADRYAPEPYVESVRECAVQALPKYYAHIESLLAEREWFVGNTASAVDVYLYGLARWGASFFSIREMYPQIAALTQRLESDPAVQFALSAEQGTLPQSSTYCEGFVALRDI